jgi:thioredoxin-related protein
MPPRKTKNGYKGSISSRRNRTKKTCSKNSNDMYMWLGLIVIILIIIGIACACNNDDGTEGFFNTIIDKFKSIGGGDNIKDLDIMFFMSPTCPWCTKMQKVMKDEGTLTDVTIVDVTKPEGQEIAKKYGSAGKGIPNFISKKLKTGTVGFKQTTKELVESLKKAKEHQKKMANGGGTPQKEAAPKMNPTEAVSKIQALQLVLFASPTCGWCTKQKDVYKQAGVLDAMEVVDISTPDGKAKISQMVPDFKGVPVTVSQATGKSAVGYRPLDQIVVELS